LNGAPLKRLYKNGAALTGPIWDKYVILDGPWGFLGLPVSAAPSPAADGGMVVHFQHGSITWSPTQGYRVVDQRLTGFLLDDSDATGAVPQPLGPTRRPTLIVVTHGTYSTGIGTSDSGRGSPWDYTDSQGVEDPYGWE